MWANDATIEIVVRQRQGRAAAEDLVAWATDQLSQGLDSTSLVVLAGMDVPVCCSLSEAEEYFFPSLAELGIKIPDEETLYRDYSKMIARRILEGSIAAQEALNRIHRRVVDPLDHPWDLAPWCFLWEGNDPWDFGRWSMTEDQLTSTTRRLAQLYIAADQTEYLQVAAGLRA